MQGGQVRYHRSITMIMRLREGKMERGGGSEEGREIRLRILCRGGGKKKLRTT